MVGGRRLWMWMILVAVISTFMVLGSFLPSCDANPSDGTIYVPDNYPTIQQAIDNAVDGGTIIVRNGTYNEVITINKPLCITSEYGAQYTIIDGQGAGQVVLINADNVTFQGFTVENATWYGIFINERDTSIRGVRVLNNIIHNVTNIWGAGIAGHRFSGEIAGNRICDCSGSGINLAALDGNVSVDITNNHIYNNSEGIFFWGESGYFVNANIAGNEIYNNEYGIYLYSQIGDIEIHYNNIHGNINYGIFNDVNKAVNAEYNWWGSANGPTHPSNTYNVGYQGDNVSNNVEYCPWLLNPYPQPTNVSSFNITRADFNMTGFSSNPEGPDYLNITNVEGTYNMDIPPAGTKYVVVISGWLEADFDENGVWDTHFDFFENIGPRTSPGPSTSWKGTIPFTVAYAGTSYNLTFQYDIDLDNASYPCGSFGSNAHANFTISGPDILAFNTLLTYLDNTQGGGDGYIDGLVKGNINVSCIPLGCPVKNINTGRCYCSIQSAIDNARDGDTIVVGPGIYRESLIINKPLKIIGDPVIDAHGSKYGVQIQANHTLIENFTIYNYTEIGIYIHNDSFTLQNVTVNNCRIFNSTYNTGDNGIKIGDAKDVLISNCQIYNNSEIGIYIISLKNGKLENNTISNSEYGFKLSSSKYNSLLNNTLVGNEQGIYLSKSSSRNTLANNHISASYYGIYVRSSSNQILNNTLLCNGGEGIYLESAKKNLVENNTVSGGCYGIHLHESDNNVLSSNVVNSTSLYNDKAIYLESAKNNLIDNNIISGGYHGIYLYKSDENTLSNNTLKSNRYCGILVSHSNGNTIDNNTIIGGADGIYLDNSGENTITNNTISNSQNGIWLTSSNGNQICENFLSGISWDLYVLDSEENIISNNTFSASYPTTATLRYKGNFAVKGVNAPPEDPDGFDDIGSFLNISSLGSTNAWINLSIRYNESKVIIRESHLLIWMYNETGWHKESWNGTRYLDTTKNIIGVNITNPDGIFAPLQDVQPPVSTKTIGDPNCTICGKVWITIHTPVWLDAEDNINGTGLDAICYRVWFNGSWHPVDLQDHYGSNHNITAYNNTYWYVYRNDTVDFGPIHFREDGKHYLEFFSTDRAGNEEIHKNQTIYVDTTPPQVTVETGAPSYIQNGKIFINSSTPIWINVTDLMNLYIINWTIWNETGAVYSSGMSEENLTLYIVEEGKYTIGCWAEDKLGNRWPASGYDNTTVYVDNSPPEAKIEIGDPHTEDPPFVTARTPFNLSSEDGGKYPVGVEKILYRVWNIYTGWSDWKIYLANFTLHEEGLHYIECYAEDHLGNRGNVLNATCYVDDIPPVTTGQGYYPIYLRAVDPRWDGCPGVGVCCIHYRYRIGDGNWTGWFVNETRGNLTLWIPNSSVSPGGEPIHLEYYSEDLLGNEENIKYEIFTRKINHPPLKPSNPSPANNSGDISTNPILSVYISDPDDDPLDVYFYNADNDNLIGSVKNVPSDSRVSIEWKNLERNRTYAWYVVVNDSEYSVRSDTWYFRTTSKNLAPYVKLIKPANAIYLLGREIIPFPLPVILGKIGIEVNATDSDGTIEKVEFYVDDTLKHTDTAEPYRWEWDEKAIGLHKIVVVAYDDCGEATKTSKTVLILNLKLL